MLWLSELTRRLSCLCVVRQGPYGNDCSQSILSNPPANMSKSVSLTCVCVDYMTVGEVRLHRDEGRQLLGHVKARVAAKHTHHQPGRAVPRPGACFHANSILSIDAQTSASAHSRRHAGGAPSPGRFRIIVSCTDSLLCMCTYVLLFCWLACLLARCRPSSSPLSTLASGRTTTLSSFSTWPTTSELCHGGLALAARPHSLGL